MKKTRGRCDILIKVGLRKRYNREEDEEWNKKSQQEHSFFKGC